LFTKLVVETRNTRDAQSVELAKQTIHNNVSNNMKKLLLILFIIPTVGLSQTKYDQHDELISKANKLKNEANYEEAIITYEMALDILIPNSSTPFFNVAECALKLDNIELADTWIRKGISQGGAQMEYLRKYKGFSEIQDAVFYKKIVADYNSLRQQYFSTIENIDIYLEIEKLVARDQFVRKIDDYISGRTQEDISKAMEGLIEAQKNNDTVAEKKYRELVFPKPNKEYQKLQNELMQKVDSLNIDRLMEITNEHGWQERAWLILWHQRGNHDEDNYVWNYFRPLINKEIEEGKMSRSFWYAFDLFKEMMDSGKMGTIQLGEKPKNKREKN
jgi:tetratricopeptide (TPR) repeat protein